jgi:5-methyltetrahydropteroyltriglutamate--homocysteine methyltransferase
MTPLLPTTIIGSYSLPPWLERVRELGAQGVLNPEQIREAHDNAVKSCIKDQETAGVDVVTDGELRRETMVNFFSSRIHGFDMTGRMKQIGNLDPSIQMQDPVVRDKVRSMGDLGMEEHFAFLREHTTRAAKVCVTGPHMLAKRATNEYYKDERELVTDLAEVLRGELVRLVNAGCDFIQIDEPVWVGFPDEMPWLIEVFNALVKDLPAKIALHVCYGNYRLKRLFTGSYADLFPAILDARVDQLSMEFAVTGMEGLELFREYSTDKEIVVGVIDVKNPDVETPEVVAVRIGKALEFIAPEKLCLSPDCGMKFMPRDRAFAKLRAMVDGARIVRKELAG